MTDMGDRTLAIYFYDGDALVDSILASSSGKVSVRNKTCVMKNAEQFIERILEIAERTS